MFGIALALAGGGLAVPGRAVAADPAPAGVQPEGAPAVGGGAPGRGAAGAAHERGAQGVAPAREQKVTELKAYLAQKEAELARLTALHRQQLKDADELGRTVAAQKERQDGSWFGQGSVERNMARLRAQLEEIEKVTARETEVREEAFAAASAIVVELEDFLDVAMHDLPAEGAGRKKGVERVLMLERDRRTYQGKMNALTPEIPLPAELPTSVNWTAEMVEDQRRVYEAAIARLQADREQLTQQQRLRSQLAESVSATMAEDSAAVRARTADRIAAIDRKLRVYRVKLDRLAAPRPAEGGAAPRPGAPPPTTGGTEGGSQPAGPWSRTAAGTHAEAATLGNPVTR